MSDRPSWPRQAFVAGEWRSAARTFPVRNPATGETLAEVADCGADEARRALEAAVEVFPSWKNTPGAERSRILRKWFDLMTAQAEPIAKTMTLEMGKPIVESRGEVKYAASFVDYYAEAARRIGGELLPTPEPFPHKRLLVRHEPVGPAYGITPWNFPAAMVTRKAAPALAAGCPFILKPAEQIAAHRAPPGPALGAGGRPGGDLPGAARARSGAALAGADHRPAHPEAHLHGLDRRRPAALCAGRADLEARLAGAGRERALPRLRRRRHREGGQGGRRLEVPQRGPDLHLHEPGARPGRGPAAVHRGVLRSHGGRSRSAIPCWRTRRSVLWWTQQGLGQGDGGGRGRGGQGGEGRASAARRAAGSSTRPPSSPTCGAG